MKAGEDGAQPVLSGAAGFVGFVGMNSNADQEVGLFTRLHPAGSPFGRNAFIIHILGLPVTTRHTHAQKEELLLTMNHTPIWQIILKLSNLKTAGVTGSNILAAIDMMK